MLRAASGCRSLMSVKYEREYPVWPWKEWGKIEADKARLEEAVHRTAARKFYETMSWDRCSHCNDRVEMVPTGEEQVMPKTGRVRFVVRCSECWETSLRSRHPNPVKTPGLVGAESTGDYNSSIRQSTDKEN